ncbi:MAG TPA: HAMP domain-containing methyl-accepting chemotaxis protein [Candidatus Competibacter sp.]|nr:HAMP domain-containing methyl-accepting chemotaxis protein [Candidatus Competibacter sp.]
MNLFRKLNPFRKLKITQKLGLLLTILVLGFAILGATFYQEQQTNRRVTAQISAYSRLSEASTQARNDLLVSQKSMADLLRNPTEKSRKTFLQAINNTNNGAALLEKYAFNDNQQQLISQLKEAISAYQRAAKTTVDLEATQGADKTTGIHQLDEAIQKIAREEMNVENLIDSTVKVWTRETETVRTQGDTQLKQINNLFISVLIGVAFLALLATLSLTQKLRRSLHRLQGTVQQVTAGDLEARARMSGSDELALLGNAFDRMLDERVADLAKQAQENEQINNSVIQLMDAADRLCQRDLTVMVPVGADITGNVSDALNQMTRQTARVMGDINKLAAQLETVAGTVRRQGGKVSDVATVEREVVQQVLDKLAQSVTTMVDMAKLAASCNEIGDKASRSTKQALLTVRDTVQSINGIRSSVSETEKSIKRLGERSQEIGGIVEIIKDIAERTHTLAINAGMQAVAAGEAGRGFSVVADEVQRLAETARESTRQIAALVQSIQAESSETMSTMNKTISQVVAGSELAEKAGQRMRFTQRNTQELVTAVQQIAERSKVQEAINVELHDQANKLEQSTVATEQELREQIEQAENMFGYLGSLVKSVRVFKLPEAA